MTKEYRIKELIFENGEAKLKQEIKMDSSYFTKILDLENVDISNFAKVLLPKKEEYARRILKNGFKYDGCNYKYFITSPSILKKDNGQVLFINEKVEYFKEKFENIVSLNKLGEMKDKHYLNINKDIISRVSLAMSSSTVIDISDFKILVLPEYEYKYTANYLSFKSVDRLDKEIDLKDFRLEEHPNKEFNHSCNDGAGFATPTFFKHIAIQLHSTDKLSWITFRTIGNAGKGLICNFSFKDYYKEVHDLDKVEVIDAWGNPQNLMDFDIILNKSQVKWLNFYNSQEEFNEMLEKSKYKDLYKSIAICKYNKAESKTHTTLNYQILSNLAINHKQLNELAKEDIRVYEEIIKNRDKDLIRLLMGDVVCEDEEILSATSRIHKLIQLDQRFMRTQSAKYIIDRLVDKKINNLAGLDITTVSEYKTVVQDPISYFDSIAFLKDINETYFKNDKNFENMMKVSKNGLKEETIYVKGETGNRVLTRCPLNSATEILKREVVKNELLDKYLYASTDLIVYGLDNTLNLQSGADTDGDIICTINNKIIYDAVIEDIDDNGEKWYFYNQLDGQKADDVLYTEDNIINNILESRGNLIGKYSNYGAILSDINLQIPYKNKEGKFASYYRLMNGLSVSREKSKKMLNNRVSNGEYELMSKEEYDNRIVEIANKNFQQNKIWSYYLTYLQMVLIDKPKTGIGITEDMLKKLEESGLTYTKKPLYIYYSKFKKENKMIKYEDCKWTNSSLTNYSQSIIAKIGSNARKEERYRNDVIFEVLNEIDMEVSEELLDKLTNLYSNYHDLRNKVPETDLVKIYKKDTVKFAEYSFIRDKKYDLIDIEIYDKYQEIIDGIDKKVLLKTVAQVRKYYNGLNNKINSSFITKFVFDDLIEHMISINNKATAYVLDNESGDIQYFYNKYRKVEGMIEKDNLVFKEIQKKKIDNDIDKETRILISKHNELTDEIKVENKVVLNGNGKILGNIFDGKKDKGKYLLEDGIYKVDSYDYKTRNNDKYELATSMSIYVKIA